MKRLRDGIAKALAVLVGGTSSTAEPLGAPLIPVRGGGALPSVAVVGGLPLPSLELGGVGVQGDAGAASFQGGSVYVSAASYPANAPVEDRFDVRDCALPGAGQAPSSASALTAAVYDGHGGWQASELARSQLLERFAVEAAALAAAAPPTALAGALARAFEHTERAFTDAIRPAYGLGFGELAHVGACALVAVLTDSTAIVANAGDCRAVLGHLCSGRPPPQRTAMLGAPGADGHAAAAAAALEASGRGAGPQLLSAGAPGTPPFLLLPEPAWQWRQLLPARGSSSQQQASAHRQLLFTAAIPMSLDNNAREPREKARLAAEHPGEAGVVVCRQDSPTSCYVKGRLQPTRALGDAYLKYAEFNENGGRARGRHIKAPYTPPYISSTPEVRIQPLAVEQVQVSSSSSGSAWSFLPWSSSSSSSSSPTGSPAASGAQLFPQATATFLLLACDGVWDVLTNEEACEFIARDIVSAAAGAEAARALAVAGGEGSQAAQRAAEASAAAYLGGTADRLRLHVLDRIAAEEGVQTRMLLGLKPGKGGRRAVHDDITAVVCFVGGLQGVARFASAGSSAGLAPLAEELR